MRSKIKSHVSLYSRQWGLFLAGHLKNVEKKSSNGLKLYTNVLNDLLTIILINYIFLLIKNKILKYILKLFKVIQ